MAVGLVNKGETAVRQESANQFCLVFNYRPITPFTRPQFVLALLQFRLEFLLLGKVNARAHVPGKLPVGAQGRRPLVQYPFVTPAQVTHPILQPKCHAPDKRPLVAPYTSSKIVRM